MQNITISFIISVCPSKNMYPSDSQFRDITYLGFLDAFRFWFNSDKYPRIFLEGVKKNHRLH